MNKSILIRVAKFYYEQNMTQQEIANILGTSRMSISRMLQKAREEGITDIKINYDGSFIEMEDQIKTKYNLREVLITPLDKGEKLKQVLAEAAASLLSRILKNEDFIAVGWGSTLSHIASYVDKSSKVKATFVPLVGGYGQMSLEMHANQIASKLAAAFHGNAQYLHAPAIVDTLELKNSFITDNSIKAVLEMGKRANIALLGIGAPFSPESTLFDSGYFIQEDINELQAAGAECDIASCIYLDKEGKECAVGSTQRVVGISADDLKKIPLVIGVAGGNGKHTAVHLAAQSGYFDVIITDEETGKFLLKNK